MGRSTSRKSDNKKTTASHDESHDDVMFSAAHASQDVHRVVMLHGEVNEYSISNVIASLIALANINHNPIYLVVSTYGGSVDEMFSLYDVIKLLPCPVYTIGLGKVMSAGVVLLSAGAKGNRVLGRNARVMMHPVRGGAFGNVFEMQNENQETGRIQDQMVEILAKETGQTVAKLNKIMKKGHDYYLSPEEAVKLGIVDKLT